MTFFAQFLHDDFHTETKPEREEKPPRVKPPSIKRVVKWTPEKIELAKKLWQDGLSAKNVAAELGPEFTRNAVLGKIHRSGSQARPEPLRPTSDSQPPRNAAARPELRPTSRKPPQPFSFKKGSPMMPVPFSPAPNVFTPICEPVTIMGLNERTCHWPISDDPTKTPVDEFMYCGALTDIGDSYCQQHLRLAYTGVPPRKFVEPRPRG